MPNETHRAPLRYNIPDFFSSLLGVRLNTMYQLLWDGTISGQKDERGEWCVDAESVERYRLRRVVRHTSSRAALQRNAIDVTATVSASA